NPQIPGESFTWGANGNPGSAATIIGADNELRSDGTFNYDYDNEGNMIRRTEIATGKVREFHWDERNHLTAVIDKDAGGNVVQEVDFSYDALDRRISKRVRAAGSDVVTEFVYDRDNVLLEFVDPDGPAGPQPAAMAMRYLHGPAVDQVFAQQETAGKVLW